MNYIHSKHSKFSLGIQNLDEQNNDLIFFDLSLPFHSSNIQAGFLLHKISPANCFPKFFDLHISKISSINWKAIPIKFQIDINSLDLH